MYKQIPTKQFKKDFKRLQNQHKNKNKLKYVINELCLGHTLDPKYKDHNLTNNWKEYRECHIEPNWLLIYKIDKIQNILYLARTGSHSELFESISFNYINFKQMNEDLIYELHTKMPINEMAKINGVIEVHNEDDSSPEADQLKFAHFHYKGIHFKFSRNIPKNVQDVRKMIAFKREQNKIDDHELTELCKILKSRPIRKGVKVKTVYEFAIQVWIGLNDRDVDYID